MPVVVRGEGEGEEEVVGVWGLPRSRPREKWCTMRERRRRRREGVVLYLRRWRLRLAYLRHLPRLVFVRRRRSTLLGHSRHTQRGMPSLVPPPTLLLFIQSRVPVGAKQRKDVRVDTAMAIAVLAVDLIG